MGIDRVNLKLPNLHEQGAKNANTKYQKKLYYFEIFLDDTSIDYVDQLDPKTERAPYEEMAHMSTIKRNSARIYKPEELYASGRSKGQSAVSQKKPTAESERIRPRNVVEVFFFLVCYEWIYRSVGTSNAFTVKRIASKKTGLSRK